MKITSAEFIKGITGDDNVLHNSLSQIAFVGRSNVGKSSLLNTLLGHSGLARTGKKAGKTLEINLFKVNEKYYFIDLPGYGYAAGSLDKRDAIRAMIIGFLTQTNRLRPLTVALVLDGKAGVTDFDRDMIEILAEHDHRGIIILNKSDKLNQKELNEQLKAITQEFQEIEVVPFSTVTGKGKDKLLEKLIG